MVILKSLFLPPYKISFKIYDSLFLLKIKNFYGNWKWLLRTKTFDTSFFENLNDIPVFQQIASYVLSSEHFIPQLHVYFKPIVQTQFENSLI